MTAKEIDEINVNTFYFAHIIQKIIMSIHNEYKIVNVVFYIILPIRSLKSGNLPSNTPQSRLFSFHELNSHTWLGATILVDTAPDLQLYVPQQAEEEHNSLPL